MLAGTLIKTLSGQADYFHNRPCTLILAIVVLNRNAMYVKNKVVALRTKRAKGSPPSLLTWQPLSNCQPE